MREEEKRKRGKVKTSSDTKFFQKNFFEAQIPVRSLSLMGVCPPPRVTCWYGTCVDVPVSIHYSSLWQGNLPR